MASFDVLGQRLATRWEHSETIACFDVSCGLSARLYFVEIEGHAVRRPLLVGCFPSRQLMCVFMMSDRRYAMCHDQYSPQKGLTRGVVDRDLLLQFERFRDWTSVVAGLIRSSTFQIASSVRSMHEEVALQMICTSVWNLYIGLQQWKSLPRRCHNGLII